MTVFEHNIRARIYNSSQHPYKHPLTDFAFSHSALPGVGTLQGALDWIFTVFYPNTQAAVATHAALPAGGNTIGDYRVVTDDGDGKAAGYQWQQREGDATAKWYKISDMDWGVPAILSEYLLKTQEVYAYRYGYDDLDSAGVAIAGTLAGQRIFGGATASTNFTLSANSGDGVGAQTGYVQTTDSFRPTANNTLDLGTTALKFRTGYFGTSSLIGTLTLTSGSITDSGGAISFDNENLSTTGTFSAATVAGTTSGTFGTTVVIASGSITSTTGAISFDNENLATTGTFSAATVAGTTSGTFGTTVVIASGSITSTTGAISFDNENLSTTGTFSAATVTGTTSGIFGGNVTISAASIVSSTNAIDMSGTSLTTTNSVTAGQLNVDNLRLDTSVISTTTLNTDLEFAPNGSGSILCSKVLKPNGDGAFALGSAAVRWSSLFLSTSIGDGTTTISSATIQSLRNINSGVSGGMALFWDAGSSTWLPSAPDTEITHSALSGLVTGDAGHTQFALLVGRAGGQALVGGTAASQTLTFESTSHATKGKVLTKDTFAANTDAAYSGSWTGADLGGASNRFRDVYTAGQHFGFRAENIAGDATPASSAVGRIWWNTTSAYLGLDNGTTAIRLSLYRWESDTSWDGSTLTKSVTTSATIPDARKAIWQLKDNTGNYEVMYVKITATDANTVVITSNINLPAGSYRLIGIQ